MEPETDRLKEFLTDLVVLEKRNDININPSHVTLLCGQKSKKQISKKKHKQKQTTLTRRQYAKLGLYTLPTKQMKYEEMLPLHHLWKGYMKEHLSLKTGDKIPEVHEHAYNEFSKLLVKMDLHGAKMRVLKSKCPTLIGLSGIVVLDTKNVLKVLGEDNRLRTIPKKECIFGMNLGNMEFTIFGNHLTMRPAERSTKKIKNYIQPLME